MKKIIGIFIVMLLINTIIPIISSTNDSINVESMEIDEYTGCKCESRKIITYQQLLIDSFFTNDKTGLSPKPLIKKDLPSYFNWKDHEGQDWTTSAKDQGNCGSCWDFAAIGVLESVINIREGYADLDPDLSEQYVLSCLPRAGSCKGGNPWYAYRYIMSNSSIGNNCNGVPLESCFSYQAKDKNTLSCDEKSSDWQEKLIPILDWGFWTPDGSQEDINAIKSQIMDIGPVNTFMYFTYFIHGTNNLEEWGWIHHNPEEYYPFPGEVDSNSFTHVVSIVGWKDDSSIGNGGYWIVKNSFSDEWGYDGFFNIEYGSLNIDSGWIAWVDYNKNDYNNWPPSVDAGGIYYAGIGESISFNASNTIDPEEDIDLFSWDFGDGTQKTGIEASHSYSEKGIYSISLEVTDSNGNIGYDSTLAFIDENNNPPNTPVLEGRKIGINGTSHKCTFYTSDPDGDDVYYYLNWGDTFWTGWWEGWIGPYKSNEKVTINNTWVDSGYYVVRVKAKDIYGFESDWATLPVVTPKSNTGMYHISELFGRLIERFPFLHFVLGHIK